MRFRSVFFAISFIASLSWHIQNTTQLAKNDESSVKPEQNYLIFRQRSATTSKLIYVQKVGFEPNSAISDFSLKK